MSQRSFVGVSRRGFPGDRRVPRGVSPALVSAIGSPQGGSTEITHGTHTVTKGFETTSVDDAPYRSPSPNCQEIMIETHKIVYDTRCALY